MFYGLPTAIAASVGRNRAFTLILQLGFATTPFITHGATTDARSSHSTTNRAPLASLGRGFFTKTVLDSFLAFCADSELRATYDFSGTLVHEGYKRGIAQAGRIATRARNPRLFLSYSWDSDSHRRWVLRLAADLIRNGVHVLVDEWDLRDYNDDLHLFMESGIRESDFVVLVCTPEYARRANTRQGGVGLESTIITGEFYDAAKASKFVPIARKAAKGLQTCLPSYLKSRFTIDFSDDTVYQVRLEELLRRLFGQPRYRKPDLGPIPQFRSEDV